MRMKMNKEEREISFESVGGLDGHIQTLKEMIIYPLLYRELFDTYGIQAPRGVLFYGPPGTGKTLMAGAVASECSKSCSRPVTLYTKKGGECLNKYVGESEKNLRDLFSLAYSTRPSIIFFDEIDGLVPTRSEQQGQVHASVVTTLLALMDGLDAKSEVFVIGATNRIDLIDPALRRPGRFDRELYFPLPAIESRLEILKIHTSNWNNKPSEDLMLKLAADCSGFCGADIQSLCSQAVMRSFSRSFPEVLDIRKKQPISFKNIHVRDEDFWEAKSKLVPAVQRIYSLPSSPLSSDLKPLLEKNLNETLNRITKLCPFCFMYRNDMEFSKNKSLTCPRFLLLGKPGQAHISHIAPAVLHHFDHLPVVVTDLTAISEEGFSSSDSSSFVHKVEEARQNMPSIIYLKDITAWWNLINESAKQVLISSLEGLDTTINTKIFIFGSATAQSYDALPQTIKLLFPRKKCFKVTEPTVEEKRNFFKQVIVEKNLLPPKSSESYTTTKAESIDDIPDNIIDLQRKSSGVSRLRNGKCFRPNFEEIGCSSPKKMKLKVSYAPCCSYEADPESKKNTDVVVDVQKLEKLTDLAVKVTSKASVCCLIRLYEELEIICLAFASKSDRSSLPQELEREISVFKPN